MMFCQLEMVLESSSCDDELINTFKELLQHHKGNRSIYRHLAKIHERLGNDELTLEYKNKGQPIKVAVGDTVADFIANDLDGNLFHFRNIVGKLS